jgi:SAM-dependent methyltransferase
VSDEGDPYDGIARFYDHGHGGFDEDVALYEALARRVDGTVLELGAGTGRLAIALAERRLTVTAIDRSAAMLAIARRKSGAARLRLVLGDMRSPAVSGPFGLIVCALDTFLHLRTVDDQLATLRAARELIGPGGSLVIDLPGPAGEWADWEAGARPLVLDWSVHDGVMRTSRYTTFQADPSTQIRHVTDIFEQIDADGLVRRYVAEYDLRFIFPAELELLLTLAGLRLERRYGDYDLSAFTAQSPRMIVLAGR